jgi:tetratricopeptide (TPR) repeat protein
MKKATALAIVIVFAAAACATLTPQYRLGVQAEIAKQWEEAIAAYERASLENPKEPVYRLALEQVKIKAGLYYQAEARRLLAEGKKEEAAAAYAKAVALNPRQAGVRRGAETGRARIDENRVSDQAEGPGRGPRPPSFGRDLAPRGLSGPGPVRRDQYRLRRGIPRGYALSFGFDERHFRAGFEDDLPSDEEFLPDHRRTNGHCRYRHASEAPSI